jgi:hypothetical protein
MPMIDPTPNRSEKKIMRLGRDVVYRHEIYGKEERLLKNYFGRSMRAIEPRAKV